MLAKGVDIIVADYVKVTRSVTRRREPARARSDKAGLIGSRCKSCDQARQFRELVRLAYERELSRELEVVFQHFEAWKRGEKNAFELSEEIHRFHQKPARNLYLWYKGQDTDWMVAKALDEGILNEAEVGEEILGMVEPPVSLRRRHRHDEGE